MTTNNIAALREGLLTPGALEAPTDVRSAWTKTKLRQENAYLMWR